MITSPLSIVPYILDFSITIAHVCTVHMYIKYVCTMPCIGYVKGLLSFCCKVEDLVSIELAYINTNHPDFIGGKHAAYESVLAVKVRCTPVSTCM